MKATELINKFKQILTLSTEEVIDEATTVEETVELTEATPEVENVEGNEVEETTEVTELEAEVQAEEEVTEDTTEEVEESVEESEEEVTEEVVEEDDAPEGPEEFELSTEEVETENEEVVETELAEEGDDVEDVVEEIQETKEEIKYASYEDLAKLQAELKALTEMLNNMSPKKDVPQELSAEEIQEEQVEAEGIPVSPEAEVVEKATPLAVVKGIRGASTKDVVWNKLFGNN